MNGRTAFPRDMDDCTRNEWAELFKGNFVAIMRVMKHSGGQRGQSHYDHLHLRGPHLNNDLLEFEESEETSRVNMSQLSDPATMLPFCHFPKPGEHVIGGGFRVQNMKRDFACNLFAPVHTDLGLCYSYNAQR